MILLEQSDCVFKLCNRFFRMLLFAFFQFNKANCFVSMQQTFTKRLFQAICALREVRKHIWAVRCNHQLIMLV